MIATLKKMFGIGPSVDMGELVRNGAMIVDVRTKSEFASGHPKGAINIPLQELNSGMKRIKSKDQVIITCCASGMRSASAKGILKNAGYTNVHNGGAWTNLSGYNR
jgi:rhodanese-related sulfurtransferase